MKKVLSIVLAFLIMISSVGVPKIYAEPDKTPSLESVADLRHAVEDRLSKYNGTSMSKYGGYMGVFYNLEMIMQQAIWVDFVLQDKTLGIVDSTKDHYRDELLKSVKEFNEFYTSKKTEMEDTKNDKMEFIFLDELWFSDKTKVDIGALSTRVAAYINKYMDSVLGTESDETYLKKYKKVFRYIYDIINSAVDVPRTANSFIPFDEKASGTGAVVREPKYDYSASRGTANLTKDLLAIMDPSGDTETQDTNQKSRLLRKSKEVLESEMQLATPDTIDNKNLLLLDRFYKGGSFTNKELINSYYMIFAASATYDPFISKVGDDYFKSALMNLTGENEENSALMELFNEAKMYKKPLYHRQISGTTGKPQGPAERITVSTFIDSINGSKGGALVMPMGMMAKSKDDDSYNYYNIDRFVHSAKASKDKAKEEGVPDTSINDTNNPEFPSEYPENPTDTDEPSTGLQDDANSSTLDVTGDQPQQQPTADGYTNGSTSIVGGNDQKKEQKAPHEMSNVEWEETIRDAQFNPDGTAITNIKDMTPPVFLWGEFGSISKSMHTGTVVAKNIMKDVTKTEKFKKDNRALFMNAFGDIVTEDDTVIIPGASNATMYNDDAKFYPYSIGFLKSYPALDDSAKVFNLQEGEADKGKYVLSIKGNGNNEEQDLFIDGQVGDKIIDSKPIIPGEELNSDNDHKVFVREIKDEKNLNIKTKRELTHGIQGDMKDFGGDISSMMIFKNLEFDGKWFNNVVNTIRTNDTNQITGGTYEAFLIKTLTSSISGDTMNVLFSSEVDKLSPKDLGVIAMNYYWGIMDDGSGVLSEPNGKLNTELLSLYVVPQALNGTPNSKAYVKNIVEDYDAMVKDIYSRFTQLSKDIVKSSLNTLGEIRGVLGMRSAYQDPILGKLMTFSQEYWPYLAVIMIALVAFRLFNSRSSLGGAVVITGTVLAVGLAFTSIIPVYIPLAFNMFNNNMSLNLAYTSLGMKAENYEQVYTEELDKDGRQLMYTTSLNLYKLPKEELEYLCKNLGIPVTEISDGKAFALDPSAGIYLEGNIIKINIDKLFKNLPVTGKYVGDKNGGMYYEVTASKQVSSSLDYYTPYNLVLEGLIGKLNDLSKIYQLERSVLKYDGMTKDSFIFNAYTNSAPYLAPGEWNRVSDQIEPEVLEQLKNAFGDNHDFLGIADILINPPEEAKESLWYHTALKNGYLYIPNDKMPKDKIDKVQGEIADCINKVNRLTKKLIEDHREDFLGMSDENVIKIVSLYATSILSQEIGNWGDMLYPMFLNYEEMRLDDVLVATYSNAYDRLQSETINIVDYITYQHGMAGLFILSLVMFCAYSTTFLLTLLIPGLYVILAVLLMLKFVRGTDIKGVTFGYLKCTAIVFISYSLSTLSFSFVHGVLGGSFGGLLLQGVLFITILETLIRLAFAIIMNFSELGNDKMHSVAPFIMQKTGMVDMLEASMFKVTDMMDRNRPAVESTLGDAYDVFKSGRSIDELYDSEFMLRSKMKEQERYKSSRKADIRNMEDDDIESLYEDL